MSGAICNGGEAFESRRYHLCPTEGRVRRFYVRYQHWYGSEWQCLGCGDRWQDGERGERSFMRGWREKAIARARAGWDGVTVPARERRAAFRVFLDASRGDDGGGLRCDPCGTEDRPDTDRGGA